jgi:histidinol-phosphate/aromatic aminotransferase/cobyric acid decarboxylase-like protein
MLERQRQLLAEVARNKAALLEMLAGRAFLREIIPGEANFVLARVGSGADSGAGAEPAAALLAFCAGRGVILRGFPAEPLLRGYIRITVGTRDEIAALSALLDEWGQRT